MSSPRRLKISLPVVSNNGKKTNVLEIETVFNDGQLSGGGRRYCYRVSTVEKGPTFTAFTLSGTTKQHTIEGANRFNAKRLEQLHAEAARQVAERSGIIWPMVEAVLLGDNLTLISNEPLAA